MPPINDFAPTIFVFFLLKPLFVYEYMSLFLVNIIWKLSFIVNEVGITLSFMAIVVLDLKLRKPEASLSI